MRKLRIIFLLAILVADIGLGPIPPFSSYRNPALADLVRSGRGDVAAPLLVVSALLGDPIAKNNLGVLQMRGEGVTVNWHAAQANFVAASAKGVVPARYNLAAQHDIQAFHRPSGDPFRTQSQRFAISMLGSLAEAGDWRAAGRLAPLLQISGPHVSVSTISKWRLELLRQAAGSGDAEARFALAYELLLHRVGTSPLDPDADVQLVLEAWSHVRAVIGQGLGKGAWLVAMFRQRAYDPSYPLPPEIADSTAIDWLVRGAELGDMASICQAGHLLSYDDENVRGWGVAAPDYARATAWLRQCGAAQGKSKLPPVAGGEALYVADPDPVMAIANDDAARALLRLGDLSRDGVGQPPDLAAARTYYQQAAAKGLEEAKRRLDEISRR